MKSISLTCLLLFLVVPAVFGQSENTFVVRIENVSTPTTLEPSDGSTHSVPLAPGVWVVHTAGSAPLFTPGEPDRGEGLEALAEDGNPAMIASTLGEKTDVLSSGAFTIPVGAEEPAPIGPGGAYEFTLSAPPGAQLLLATMFVHSNDLFYASNGNGIALYTLEGDPISGDVTDQIMLWDAGTEANQEPGIGPDQAPSQSDADTGASDPDNLVRLVDDGFTYPSTSDVVRITVLSLGETAVSPSSWGVIKNLSR